MSDDEGQFDDTHDESLLKAAEAFQVSMELYFIYNVE